MAHLNILRYPDPRLHTVARPVAQVDARIRQLEWKRSEFATEERFKVGRHPRKCIGPHQRAQLGNSPFGIPGLHQHVLAAQQRYTGGQIG